MALPISSAMESTTIFSQRRFSSASGMESVTMSLRERALLDLLHGLAGQHGVGGGGQHLARPRVLEGLGHLGQRAAGVHDVVDDQGRAALHLADHVVDLGHVGLSRRLSTMASVASSRLA